MQHAPAVVLVHPAELVVHINGGRHGLGDCQADSALKSCRVGLILHVTPNTWSVLLITFSRPQHSGIAIISFVFPVQL